MPSGNTFASDTDLNEMVAVVPTNELQQSETATTFCEDTDQQTAVDQQRSPSKRISKTCVQVRVVFLKIGEIDTVKEQYSGDIYVQAKWREPLLDHKSAAELKMVDFKAFWNPRLFIENELSEKKSLVTHKAVRNERGEVFISEWRKTRGDFFENLELQNFPFDVQDLTITVVSEREDKDVEIVEDVETPSAVNVGTFLDEQEWQLYQHVDVARLMHLEFANEKHKHSAIKFKCQAARRPGFFYYNIFLVMFFISCLSFGTFAVDCNLSQNRLQLTFTLVLTAVAFKIAIGSSLPKISYLTFADKYVLLSLFFLVVICAWHSVVPQLCADKSAGSFYQLNTEKWVILGFFILYALGHVIFAILVYVRAWRLKAEVAGKDCEFRKIQLTHHRRSA